MLWRCNRHKTWRKHDHVSKRQLCLSCATTQTRQQPSLIDSWHSDGFLPQTHIRIPFGKNTPVKGRFLNGLQKWSWFKSGDSLTTPIFYCSLIEPWNYRNMRPSVFCQTKFYCCWSIQPKWAVTFQAECSSMMCSNCFLDLVLNPKSDICLTVSFCWIFHAHIRNNPDC